MITTSKPWSVRQYGDRYHGRSVYYTRTISKDGVEVGVWEGYAQEWAKAWALIRQGRYSVDGGFVNADYPRLESAQGAGR